MKRFFHLWLLLLVLLCGLILPAHAEEDIVAHRDCIDCGMDRKAYGFSRMLIVYADGSEVGLCSLHCTVLQLDREADRAVKAIFVADRDSRVLIPAETAIWVIGGKKRGVMTNRPKWAFASQTGAAAFIAVNGGEVVGWTETLRLAREDAAPKTDPKRKGPGKP